MTLFCLLSGHLPFEAENPLELYEAIRDKPCVASSLGLFSRWRMTG